jgi:hypothetical protein
MDKSLHLGALNMAIEDQNKFRDEPVKDSNKEFGVQPASSK